MIEKDVKGRFVKGNRGGPGYPAGKRRNELQAVLLQATTQNDIRRITKRLIDMSMGEVEDAKGNLQLVDHADSIRAAKIVFDFVMPPQEKTLNVKGKLDVEHDIRPGIAAIQSDPAARAAAMVLRDRLRELVDTN